MFEINYNLLKSIIDDNKNTEFGKKYNFSEIKTIEDYKKNVPLSKYDDYEPYITRMYEGEKNILTAYPVITYLYTTGSETSIQKNIPLTIKSLKNLGNKVFVLRNKTMSKYEKNYNCHILHIANHHIDITNEPPKECLLTEIMYYYFYKDKIEDFNQYFGGPDLAFDIETIDYLYEKIWISILVDYIEVMDAIYLFSVLQFFIEFERSYKDIISDIRKRKINPKKKLSEKAKKYLLELPVSEERLQFVEMECQKGFDNIASRLWKNLHIIIGIRSKAFIYENKALDKYTKDIDKGSFLFGSSESFYAFPIEINSFNYLIDPTFCFYEFIPYNEDNQNNNNMEKTFLINEVEIDKYYEMVITTLSGLYRYKTGDIIKITKNKEDQLLFEFFRRKNLIINIKQEKTTIIHIEKMMKKFDEIIPDILGFLIGATMYNNIATYFLILCLDNTKINIKINELEEKMELFLFEIQLNYKHYRELGVLGPAKIIIKNKEQFNEIQTFIKKAKSHNKQKYIIPEAALTELLKKEGYIIN